MSPPQSIQPLIGQDFDESVEVRINRVLALFRSESSSWDGQVLSNCKLISWAANTAVFEFTVTESMLNRTGNLHGGCAATLGDMLSGLAFMTIAKPGFLDGGHVSRTLQCTYFRPAQAGTVLRVYCEVVAAGRQLAHCRADFKTLDGKMVVAVTHDKVLTERPKM